MDQLLKQALVAFLAIASVTAGTLSGAPASAKTQEAGRVQPPVPSPGRSVTGVKPLPTKFVTSRDAAKNNHRPTRTEWPKPAAAQVDLTPVGTQAAAAQGKVRAAGTPVWVQPTAKRGVPYAGPQRLDVRVLDRAATEAAGIDGVLLTVAPQATTASKTPGGASLRVGLDYAGFAEAYGGNYGYRLKIVQLPACALTTPKRAECRTLRPLPSSNDVAGKTVSAEIPASAIAGQTEPAATATTVLAAVAGAGDEGGAGGTYAATDLNPSGSWTAGGSTGSFSYSYPLTVPSSRSKLAPQLALSYSSSAVDGQTAATNAQASWVGDGWSTPRNYVEQTFVSCKDDPRGSPSPKKTYDRCYAGPILTLSLNGSSASMVWDAGKKTWKLQSDNGSLIKKVTGSNNGSDTYNTDYWRVTEPDGTIYEFGRNRLPGWSAQKPETNSVDYSPVYSPHDGDPCYDSAGFTASVCTMAYRWNLDYVKDVHGNAMSYYYKQDTNYYGRDEGTSDVPYIRDSWLERIDYGFTDGNAYGTVPNRVIFHTDDRCLSSTCKPLNDTTKASWPDVPFDLICNQGTDCRSWSPSFFSTVRLTSIEAQQYNVASAKYEPVDSYALTHTMPPTGDGTAPTLWLTSITRTGRDLSSGGSTTPISLPSVSFTGIKLPNRVDVTGGFPSFYRQRIETITTETGSVITASYELPLLCTAPVTTSPASNTRSCYPVYWAPDGLTNPIRDWFHKYAVTKVSATDPTGGAPKTSTSYKYVGGAAWHYDDNEVVKTKYRTYGQFRGYGTVETRNGDVDNDPQTLTVTAYYRGMSKNNNTTVVNVRDSAGGDHEDLDQLAGRALETTTYRGDGGPVETSTVTSYWVSPASATRNRTGLPALTATRTAPIQTWSRQAVTTTGTTTWRYSQTDHTYDTSVNSPTFGLLKHSYEHSVPVNPAYDRCTSKTYAPTNIDENNDKNIVGLISEIETVSVACGGFTQGSPASVPGSVNTLTAPATVNRPTQVVSHIRTYYDDPAFDTTFPQPVVPTKGIVTMVRKATGYVSGAYVYQTTDRAEFDTYGRAVGAYDANGNKTTTSYTDNAVGLTTGTKTTNAEGHSTSSTVTPKRNLTTVTTDANSIVTSRQFDALGRVKAIWLASRAPSNSPHYRYTYTVEKTGPTATTVEKLNNSGSYAISTSIYDAQLRPRQTQVVSPAGGRLITDTFYDSRGWVRATYNGWWDAANSPGNTPVYAADLGKKVLNQTFNTYDGAGRAILVENARDNLVVSSTRTVYNGDRTTVLPPTGGTTTTTVTDPMGRTTQLLQYTAAPTLVSPSNSFTGAYYLTGGTTVATSYGFDGHGNQSTLTDAAGNTWTREYDLLGRVTSKSDPDAGISTTKYDGIGNITEATDARLKTVSYSYDKINRKIGSFAAKQAAQSSTNQIASWVYDNDNAAVPGMTNPIGKLTTTTAYRNNAAYITQYNGFNTFGSSTGETITIPATEGLLGNTYTVGHRYLAVTNAPYSDTYQANGGLPTETVTYGYTGALELPTTASSLLATYANVTHYDAWGRVTGGGINASTSQASLVNTYDDHTGRLMQRKITKTTTSTTNVGQRDYKYDLFGNTIKQVETRHQPSVAAETQCYRYNSLRQVTSAWTATDDCAVTPTSSNRSMVSSGIGSTSAYWTEWTVDALGNRKSQKQYSLTGGTDTTTNYIYNGNGEGQPNTLTSTSTTGGLTGSTAYTYDESGNMTTRTAGRGNQTLRWDDTGELAAVTGGTGGDSSFLYDADGNLLIQKDPGQATLYLPTQQITLNTSTQNLSGVRYYPLPNGATAVRTGTGTNYSYVIPDHQGTPSLYLNNTAQIPTWRQYTPYGEPRGATVTSPDNRGFLNQPLNTNTGLTQVSTRNYDPTIGRFVSLDPLQDLADPQQWNGYAYANNSPVTFSDPSGLINDDCAIFDCYGYDPNEGCPHGCGSTDNVAWGIDQGLSGTAPKKRNDPRILGNVIRVPETISLEEFTRRWNAQRGKWFGSSNFANDELVASDERALAMNICHEMGRPGGCQEWIEELYSPYIDHKAATLPSDDLIPGGTGALGAAAGAGRAAGGSRPGGSGCSCGCKSFSGDTEVLMADGTKKRLDEISPGDEVMASDPETGEQGPRVVTDVWVHSDDLIRLDLAGGSVMTTEDHPFWNHTDREWQRADELDAGDVVKTADGGTRSVIGLRLVTGRTDLAYNLTVDGIHTYYVMAGEASVLVHNTGDDIVRVGRWMSQREYDVMVRTGRVQPGAGGLTYVVYPASRDAFKPTWPGSVYAEFDVPRSSLIQGGRPGDYKMAEADTLMGRYLAKKGGTPGMPNATNIGPCS
ncbi:intein/intein/RHS repeat-associated protein [Micromonospora sp. M71_S20]|uniref:TreTu family toxin n=1 Tax=Micromonospora sp. M71_S20 TaxID=592872 RepID=UPI000F0E1AE5|nr:RHS repeat-associated core domain-containing protein [Micromonospora sp. M71_S20]RLK09568.1 intein/intein/RHS repeat-associated protein [Micromonospora sp. M71_S20]